MHTGAGISMWTTTCKGSDRVMQGLDNEVGKFTWRVCQHATHTEGKTVALRLILILVLALFPAASFSQEEEPEPPAEEEEMEESEEEDDLVPDDFVDLRLNAEIGFLGVLKHTIQFGRGGTTFDYVDEGGQDVLFFFGRLSADITLADNHQITLLYQPLQLEGRTVLKRDHVIDGVTFNAGTGIDTVYSFPFWRISYAYDLIDNPHHEAAIGISLQIRDATIDFTSSDGEQRISNRDIGPVPVLRFKGKMTFTNGLWLGTEIDGFYAPISVLNGSDSEVTGAILDASLRAGLLLDEEAGINAFVNLRYLGGGAVGESNDDDEFYGDGFNENWLHFLTLSLGFSAEVL